MKNNSIKLTVFLLAFMLVSMVNASCVINIESPSNNGYVSDSTPDFIFNVTGNITQINTTLYVNGVIYGNDDDIQNNTQSTITPTLNVGMENTWYLYSLNQSTGINCTSSTYTLDYGSTRFRGMSKLIGFVKDIVSIIPTLISLVIFGGVLIMVGVFASIIVKWVQDKI